MKKFLQYFSLAIIPLFIIHYSLFIAPKAAHAESTKPFPPFSIEGNPEEKYYFEEIFPLFKYIRFRSFKIFENRDRSRQYPPYEICDGGDGRDYVCAVDNQSGEEIDTCEGGPVDICLQDGGGVVYTAESSPNGSCTAKPNPELKGTTRGKCSYLKKPSISRTVKGTDFSAEKLIFPKLQNESYAYTYVGVPENPITYGSQQLMLPQSDKIILQLLVVKRAKQTKATLAQTGEWPLGWVDWGYQTKNGKTLIQIHDALPDGVSAAGLGIAMAIDNFFFSGGNLNALNDEGEAKAYVVKTVSEELAKNSPAEWALDLAQSPLSSPSFRQGYIRPSICKWNWCCPNPDRCPLPDELVIGTKRGLYYDTSISQAYNSALDELFITYPLEEAVKIFKNLVVTNPLIRFASSADIPATPSKIHERLYNEMKGGCLKYVPWSNWAAFGQHVDYLKPGNFLGPNKTCPDYELAPALTKDKGGAYPEGGLLWILKLIWGGKTDEVEENKFHLITIPDAMGQSIQEIQQFSYDVRDTLDELESVQEFNNDLSNTVDDEADLLYAGKSLGPADARRRLAYYSCDDNMFSAQKLTSIEVYALGTRIGCDATEEELVPEGKCDGQLFGKLLESGKYQKSSAKGETYFNTYIKGNLTPELMNTYAAAEAQTGVPCEILAGIHFVEAGNSPDGSLVSGRKLGTPEPDAGGKIFRSLLETAKYAGDHLKGKVGGNLKDVNTVITALSRYNGGGNSNCQAGYPYPIPYGGCPRAFEGEDDPYPMSFVDPKHDKMYLLYCADHTACLPQIFERPGAFAVALNVYNSFTKSGYENSQLPPTQTNPASSLSTATDGSTTSTGFFPKSCGPESLSTALGCLPYTRDAFVSALLTFIIGLSGGIALVIMLIATFQIMTAGGNPEQLKKGKDLFTSAIVGLLFLIFSVSLLRLVAGDIIKLPGF